MTNLQQQKFNDNYSQGCQSCQNGSWLCIYLTYHCNANCAFCPTPFKDKTVTAFGDDTETILRFINANNFDGISFSGGECFLVFDKFIEWLVFFKKNRSDIYFWAYTNGLAVDETKLQHLAKCGLNEIRFNIAATGYNSPDILETISIATKIINNVVVEIPSIPQHYQDLVSVLPYLDNVNVKFLNLHEYLLVPNDPYSKVAVAGTFILNKHSKIKYDAYSLQNTEKIKKFCKQNRLKIKVNNCSLQKKENQMLQRRLTMGAILKKEYEKLTDEGLLETFLIYPEKLNSLEIKQVIDSKNGFKQFEKYFIHPETVSDRIFNNFTSTVIKLSFLPPITIDDKRLLIDAKNLTN